MSIYGFRFWSVDTDGFLAPGMMYNLPLRWATDGPTEAQCRCASRVRFGPDALDAGVSTHRVPSIRLADNPYDRKCGIWFHTHPIPPCRCQTSDTVEHGVVGVVRGWGRYVRADTGWRTQYAQPVAVVDFTGRMHKAYDQLGIRRYPDLNTLYGEWHPEDDGTRADTNPVWHSDIGQYVPSVEDLVARYRDRPRNGYTTAGTVTGYSGGSIGTVRFTDRAVDVTPIVQATKLLTVSFTVSSDTLRVLAAALGDGVNTALQKQQDPPNPPMGW